MLETLENPVVLWYNSTITKWQTLCQVKNYPVCLER